MRDLRVFTTTFRPHKDTAWEQRLSTSATWAQEIRSRCLNEPHLVPRWFWLAHQFETVGQRHPITIRHDRESNAYRLHPGRNRLIAAVIGRYKLRAIITSNAWKLDNLEITDNLTEPYEGWLTDDNPTVMPYSTRADNWQDTARSWYEKHYAQPVSFGGSSLGARQLALQNPIQELREFYKLAYK